MKSTDRFLLEHAYYQVLTEQQRLIEEGKIWDFIKGMGNKLKNAWNVINTKIATNPKLYKTLMVAGPILASLAAKNFDNLSVSSETVKDLLNTLNGLDPNITAEDLTNVLSDWDHNHMAELAKISQHGDIQTTTVLNTADNHNGQYSFSGTHLNHTIDHDKQYPTAPGFDNAVISGPSKEAYVQSITTSLEQLTTNSDLSVMIKNFTCEIMKSTNTDGSGGTSLVEYHGTVTASSPEEAMKIINELVKTAVQKSGIDTNNLTFTPQASLASATESFYRVNTSVYLVEFEMLNKLKNSMKGTVNKVAANIKKVVVGAADIVKKIKASFKKQPGASEQLYKVSLKVSQQQAPAQQPQQQAPAKA